MENWENALQLIPSDRKTLSIRVTPRGEVVLRYPRRMKKEEVLRFAREKSAWIRKALDRVEPEAAPFTAEQLQALTRAAEEVLPGRVEYFGKQVGVDWGRITVRHQKTRWGSCSSQGNLNFNCLLMCVPESVRDYVVVHELCHRKEMNHGPRFWAEVERILPDYQQSRSWLRDHGSGLIARL